MEAESHEHGVRRRRKISRSMREKTPEPNFVPYTRRRRSEDEHSYLEATTASEEAAQTVSMQIRPPGSMSAHQSKILRRRDKTFTSTAARSHSQPRQAERLSSPEVHDLLKTAKRSLSSPRHKDESSESELTAARSLSPQAAKESLRVVQTMRPKCDAGHAPASTADENLSRLEMNLRRFEEERKRLEADKRLFEREKREHKARHKQMLDNEERRRLLQNYRKLSDNIQLPADAEERRRMVHSLRLNRQEVPVRMKVRSSVYDESSTQFSSSDPDADEATVVATRLAKQLSPVRRHATTAGSHSLAVSRGPPPQPPERRSMSRNNSLSPIRPQRRSKTPEQRAEMIRKLTVNGNGEEYEMDHLRTPERKLTVSPATTEADSELDGIRSRHDIRKEPPTQTEVGRRRSLEAYEEPKRKQSLERKMPAAVKEVEYSKKPTEEKLQTKESTKKLTEVTTPPTSGLLMKILNMFRRKQPTETKTEPTVVAQKDIILSKPTLGAVPKNILSLAFLRYFLTDARQQWRRLKSDYPQELVAFRVLLRKCFAHTIMLILLCGFGGLVFRYTEGTAENIYKCEVRKVKRDFIDNLWTVSHNMREDDWKTLARQKLRKFEDELHTMQELGVRRIPGTKSWNFVNCILFCWTVITTIGYGHITPKTTLGQSLTIVYAIIGIPMFLILLADFGKLFTRGMKFLWAYVRRLYYTGTCRQIRKQQQIRDAMSGFNTVYDMAIRRPSHFFGMGPVADVESQTSVGASHPETPTSPYPETYEIDDEFNLPVSVATFLLIAYILIGAFVYTIMEGWTYFEAFYFVFVSMSTIGFGDLVPKNPIFMMCSIIYLVFGLALTSMFINVVQIKLSDTFKQASAKIGATIGFGEASEMGDELGSQIKTPSDIASVHGSRLGKIAEDENESTLSPTSPQLTSILRPPRPVSPAESQYDEVIELENGPPPLLPRRQVSMEQPEPEKKKKKRFFK